MLASSPQPLGCPPDLLVEAVSQLTPEPLQWLWTGRLAFGKPALIDGDPDQGKSLVALDLCARLSAGRPLPDGSAGHAPSPCLLLQAEDGARDTVRPRLEALGADMDRIFVPRGPDGVGARFRFPADLDRLDGALTQTGARLLVLDPLMAFFDASVMVPSDAGVRRALDPLAALAARHRCALLLIRHLAKWGGRRALYRGGGSIGIAACCRSVWLIGREPHAAGRRVLAQVKNNLAGPQPSLAYEIVPHAGGPPTLSWLGPSRWAADQLLDAADARPTPERDHAREFVAAFLKEGPRTSREVWAAAREHDLARNTLRRAAGELRVRFRRRWRQGVQVTYWLLPGQELPPGAPPADEQDELSRFFEEQEKKYPRPCPLDDEEQTRS
jgi:hypothetical protein